jgi:hypothetical protein
MPRADRSVAILTGMIIAALYVILLVGFTQESYMRRDFDMRRDAASRTGGSGTWPVVHDVSKRVCRIEPPLCAELFPDAADRQSCVTSIDAVRRFISEPAVPLTLDGLRRAMAEER